VAAEIHRPYALLRLTTQRRITSQVPSGYGEAMNGAVWSLVAPVRRISQMFGLAAKPMPSRFMARSYVLGVTGSCRRAGARVGFIARVLDDAVNEQNPLTFRGGFRVARAQLPHLALP
jgi:hypothetical protein